MSHEHARFFDVLAGSPPVPGETPPVTLGAPYMTYLFTDGSSVPDFWRRSLETYDPGESIDETGTNHYLQAWGISPKGNKAIKVYSTDTSLHLQILTHPGLVEIYNIEVVDYEYLGVPFGRYLIWSRDERFVTFFVTSGSVASELVLDVEGEEILEIPLPDPATINAAAFSVDGSMLALIVSTADHLLLVYDTTSLTLITPPIEVEDIGIRDGLAFDADNNIVYSAGDTVYLRTAASDWATIAFSKTFTSPQVPRSIGIAYAGPVIGRVHVGTYSSDVFIAPRIEILDAELTSIDSFAAGSGAGTNAHVPVVNVSYNGYYLGYGLTNWDSSGNKLMLYHLPGYGFLISQTAGGSFEGTHVFLGGDDEPPA